MDTIAFNSDPDLNDDTIDFNSDPDLNDDTIDFNSDFKDDNFEFDIEIDNFEFDPVFYDSDNDSNNDASENEGDNTKTINNNDEIINNNDDTDIKIKETYENKYLEQFKLFTELRQYVDEKVKELKKTEEEIVKKNNDEKLELFTKLENEKQKLDIDKENLSNQLAELLEEEYNLSKPDCESDVFKILDNNIYVDNISKFDTENEEIIKEIKIKQKEKSELDAIKNEYYQEYQNSLLQNKINLKGNKMVWEQRNEYIKNKLLESQKDYQTFEKKWLQYVELYKNNKSDIEETIQVLKEDIDNMDSNTKLERRKTIKIIKQWEVEKEDNKYKIKVYSENISELEKEKLMLINKQSEWMQTIKNENLIISEKIKVDITKNEIELKVISGLSFRLRIRDK